MKKRLLSALLLFVLIFNTFAISVSAEVSVSVSIVEARPGENITATFSNVSGENAWIGFFKSDSTNREYISYSYLKSLNGTYTVEAPKELGTYNFRIFTDAGYDKKVGTSSTITVVQYAPKITTEKNVYLTQEEIVVSYSDAPIFDTAWIGFFKVGDTDRGYIQFEYLKDKTSGTYTIEAPLEKGQYDFRIFLDAGYTLVGRSQTITVEDHQPSIAISHTKVPPGYKVTATYTNGQPLDAAWIGFYKKESDNRSYISHQYTKGNTSGIYEISAPNTSGEYEFRIFRDGGYYILGKSGTLTVGDFEPTPADNSSDSPSLVTPDPTLSTPAPTATSITSDVINLGVRIQWDTVSGIGYRVYRSASVNELGISITDFYITTTTFIDVNVQPDTRYYYTVKLVISEADPFRGIDEKLGEIIGAFSIKTGADTDSSSIPRSFIILQIDNPYMIVDGKSEEVDPGRDTSPTIISSRSMVPIRAIVEAMGGVVGWDPDERKITLETKDNNVEMWLGKSNILVNGVESQMDVAPVVVNGRTLVPIRFASENLGAKVDWINSTREVVIAYSDIR
ncbi:UNVERIFIED_CONTAM: copper amine oxidase-like protein [Acetivibrio alkalicellulosi]